MKDVELIPKEYRSKSDLFLLPLTGLPKSSDIKSYMFWKIILLIISSSLLR